MGDLSDIPWELGLNHRRTADDNPSGAELVGIHADPRLARFGGSWPPFTTLGGRP